MFKLRQILADNRASGDTSDLDDLLKLQDELEAEERAEREAVERDEEARKKADAEVLRRQEEREQRLTNLGDD